MLRDFTFYLSSPNSQVQAAAVARQPVLLSYALRSNWIEQYAPSFGRILIDSGAFSAHNSGAKVDPIAYRDWHQRFPWADAVAGLDDISGDWRQSLRNYEVGGGFPTIHDTDPPELLDQLIPLARERGGWIGVGLLPPRHGKGAWLDAVLERIPNDLHVHGWALGSYADRRRLDSVDSTNWWQDGMALRKSLPWLTYAECLDLIVRRYERTTRKVVVSSSAQIGLFDAVAEARR